MAIWGWLLILLTIVVGVSLYAALLAGRNAMGELVSAPVLISVAGAGAAAIRRSPPPRVDRVFWYSGGLAQLIEGEPEPRVVRWADGVSVSMDAPAGDESDGYYLVGYTVCDESGTCVTLDRVYGSQVPADLAREAGQVLAPRLIRAFIRAYEMGTPVSFGDVWIGPEGISGPCDPLTDEPPLVRWDDMRKIDIEGPGIGITVHTGRSAKRRFNLRGHPNGPLAHHLIEHVAGPHDVLINYRDMRRLPSRLPAWQPADDDTA